MRAWPSPLQGPVSSTDREQSPAQDAFVQMKGCACARFEFWASPCVQFMSAPSMFIRGDGMQMRESDVGENPPNSGMVYLSGESQTPPAYPDRADENEAGIRVQMGGITDEPPRSGPCRIRRPSSRPFWYARRGEVSPSSAFDHGPAMPVWIR